MEAAAPTNDCIADAMASYSPANVTSISDILIALPGSIFSGYNGDACTPTSTSPSAILSSAVSSSNAVIGHLQTTISSIDLSFNIPNKLNLLGHSIGTNAVSGKYTIDLPDLQTLLGVQIGFCIAASVGILIATIIYCTLLNNNNKKNTRQNHSSSLRRGIIGSALLVTSILLPYALISLLNYQNTAVRFTICLCFVLHMFRILEAVFGFVPTGAKSNWRVYCAYFALPFDMQFDDKTDKPIMATWRDIIEGQMNIVKAVSCIVVLLSILSPYGYVPFGETNAGEFHEQINIRHYLDGKHLGNCFAIALLFQQALALGDAVIGNAIQVSLGYKPRRSMRNPMLEATSPSDFWGRRWNVLVHSVMKRGVYKPVRQYSNAVFASLAVFIASGLFHEWLVHAVFLYNQPSVKSAGVLLGSNTAFFVWNFFVIVSERILAGTKGVQTFGKMIPSVFIPFLIVMSSLPMAHWFGSPYLKGSFFGDYEKCLILIRKVG